MKPVDRLQLYSGVGVLGIFLIRLRAARPRSLLVMYHATLHNLIFFIPRKMSIEHELNYILLFFFLRVLFSSASCVNKYTLHWSLNSIKCFEAGHILRHDIIFLGLKYFYCCGNEHWTWTELDLIVIPPLPPVLFVIMNTLTLFPRDYDCGAVRWCTGGASWEANIPWLVPQPRHPTPAATLRPSAVLGTIRHNVSACKKLHGSERQEWQTCV